jgi:hypothetical protein
MSDNDSLCGDEKRVDEIKRVCALAGCSERAGQFIRQGKNVSAVLKQLLTEKIAADERAKTPDEPDVHARPLPREKPHLGIRRSRKSKRGLKPAL